MTTAATVLAVLTGIAAVTDWWAVWTDRERVRHVAKPATLALLILVALTLDPVTRRIGAGTGEAFGCDLSEEYVIENSEYST